VLATYRPDLQLTLLEVRQRACRFLREAVATLEATRVTVVEARAEDAARRPELRESFDAVVARSFGPPAVTAECAVGFLRPAGRLVVSEPPGDGKRDVADRWPQSGLDELGLSGPAPGGGVGASFVLMEKTRADDRWPRRVGMPAKRPLWTG
jgi:16S rRNA (guanine527-N7)-methyltransferase